MAIVAMCAPLFLLIWLWYSVHKWEKDNAEWERCTRCQYFNTGVCSTCFHDQTYCLKELKKKDQYKKWNGKEWDEK
jgi:hypothetical protein